MKDIAEYVNHKVDGWAETMLLPGQLVFINAQEGIQLTTDVKDYGKLQVIHASIAPLHTIDTPPTVEELFFRTAEILQLFFGNRGFAQQPLDERRPEMRHYFSILEKEDQ